MLQIALENVNILFDERSSDLAQGFD